MRKSWLIYGACLLSAILLLFIFNIKTTALLLAVMLLFPIVLGLMCSWDARKLSVSVQMKHTCTKGKQLPMTLSYESAHHMLACGRISLLAKGENILFHTTETSEVAVSLAHGEKTKLDFVPHCCGEIRMTFEKPLCRDLIGLTGWRYRAPQPFSVVVYPKEIPVAFLLGRRSAGEFGYDKFNDVARGTDASEVFDLRTYQPGDNISRIHWKLSSKLEDMVVKEASKPSNYQTLILFDAGYGTSQKDTVAKIDALFSLGMSISEALLRQGVFHGMARPLKNELRLLDISDMTSYFLMRDQWMGWALPEESDKGLDYFIAERLKNYFTKLIYLTVDECPSEIEQLAPDTNVTVVAVCDEKEAPALHESDHLQMVVLPLDRLSGEHEIHINI